jgi:hypothetical protein
MQQSQILELFKPENEIERAIVDSEVFRTASQFRTHGRSHPERLVYVHIQQILAFIDRQLWLSYRTALRQLALTHDLGKYFVMRDAQGKVVGGGHGTISERIAENFIKDPRILYAIRIHDKYVHFYWDEQKGKRFDERRFRRVFGAPDAGLATLTRFNYADSNSRKKDSIIWFEDRCVELGLKAEKVYISEPGVLL